MDSAASQLALTGTQKISSMALQILREVTQEIYLFSKQISTTRDLCSQE